MLYRDFGNTGVRVSALGFGAMRLPEFEKNGQWHVADQAVDVIRKAFELGVNLVDTAYSYCHGNSERMVGRALEGWRDRVYVSTKLPVWKVTSRADYRRFLDEQLERLGVDHIDFYHFHSLDRKSFEDVVLHHDLPSEAYKAREQGLIRHVSFSFHDHPDVMKTLADTGIFETVLCQYNLLDRANEEAMAYARAKGLGVAVMGPVAGGRLGVPSEVIQGLVSGEGASTPEVALRFVLANPNVSCALSGMSTVGMVERNAATASMTEPLSREELARVRQVLEQSKKLADLYCTGCNYCMPCPNEVNIPLNFSLMNYYRVFGLEEYARDAYRNIGSDVDLPGKRAEECVECGQCDEKCPQKIGIRRQLKETARLLSKAARR